MTRATGPEPDLAWLAFRYAAGEMGAREEAAFEQRLDDDQAAREAVAEAVALVGAAVRAGAEVGAVEVRAVRPRLLPLSLRRVLPAAALAAAAGLAGVLAWPRGDRPASAPDSAPPARTAAESVALAWSGLRAGDDGETAAPPREALLAWLDEPADPAPPVITGAGADADTVASSEPADDAESPPPWLLEAARLRGAGEPGGEGS